MNATRSLIAAIVLTAAAAGSALAQEATPDTWQLGAQTSKSRAEVSAELQAARQAGLTQAWTRGYIEPLRNSALRAEVRARTLLAIESGELDAINAEVHGDTPVTGMRMSQAGR